MSADERCEVDVQDTGWKHGSVVSPGSEIAGEAAAALSAAALMYRRLGVKRQTAAYITHAKQLYNLAVGAQGSYADANSRSCLGIHKVRERQLRCPLLSRRCFVSVSICSAAAVGMRRCLPDIDRSFHVSCCSSATECTLVCTWELLNSLVVRFAAPVCLPERLRWLR